MFLLPSAQAISGCSSPQRGCEGSTGCFVLPDTSRQLPRNQFFKRYAQVNSMEIQERLKWGHSKVQRQWLELRRKIPVSK
jgi:hypothetical protein